MTEPDMPRYCDLIMKGGITSGVVYPKVITTLAKDYRFHQIGGASAGAIAAGVAAAAEYARATNKTGERVGMAGVDALPDLFSSGVLGYFQPVPRFRKLFGLALDLMELKGAGKPGAKAYMSALQRHYGRIISPLAIAGIALGALALGAIGWWYTGLSGALNVVLATIIFTALVLVWGAVKLAKLLLGDVMTGLPENRFGICSGLTENGDKDSPGLTDWLANLLDETAGLAPDEGPLTFRMLKQAPPHGIHVQMMTTNLSMGRPHRLPLDTAIFSFEESEFRELFPERIVDHMIAVAKARGAEPKIQDGRTFWPFPGNYADASKGGDAGDDLPLVVAIRMSLSFPILIQAIPLYAVDFGVRFDATGETPIDPDKRELARCVFTDGGVSSNFPMHFFDSVLPVIPTFGVSLDEFDRRRGPSRVTRPTKPGQGLTQSIAQIDGVLGFLASILATSKDWQDTLLSQLDGYRERIASVALTRDEGGLNLAMDSTKISALGNFGQEAGANLLSFDMDEHRWRRFLTTYDKVEELAVSIHRVWDGVTPIAGEPMRTFLARYANDPERSYAGANTAKLVAAMAARMEEIAKLGGQWTASPLKPPPTIPKPRSAMRIRPKE